MNQTVSEVGCNFTEPVVSVPSISSSAMLVELNISVWTGRKFDKNVSAEIDAQKQKYDLIEQKNWSEIRHSKIGYYVRN
jgi:hypothetical protein